MGARGLVVNGEQWKAALEDPAVVARYWSKVVKTDSCWWWGGALMRSGHGRFWVGTDSVTGRDLVVIAHRFGWAATHGLDALVEVPVLAHKCDEALCQRPDPQHVRPSTSTANREEWLASRWRFGSPLRDTRGRAGRARAIRDAVRHGEDPAVAQAAGLSQLDRDQLALPLDLG